MDVGALWEGCFGAGEKGGAAGSVRRESRRRQRQTEGTQAIIMLGDRSLGRIVRRRRRPTAPSGGIAAHPINESGERRQVDQPGCVAAIVGDHGQIWNDDLDHQSEQGKPDQPTQTARPACRNEPRRDCRRQSFVSHAAIC